MNRALRLSLVTFCFVLLTTLTAPPITAQTSAPSFAMGFDPSAIGPGSASTLTFTIVNGGATPATGLAFVDELPAGVTVATPTSVFETCSGTVVATPGSSTISFSGGGLAGGSSCEIRVNVTSSTPGAHTNTSGALTSSVGNSGTASANLTVANDRPGFTKAFSPTSVPFGGRTRLTFTIDNSANASTMFNLSFTDPLPLGMTVASPANVAKTCSGGTVTAVGGSSSIAYSPTGSLSTVAAGATCTLAVDVIAGAVGEIVNVSDGLSSTASGPSRTSGKATAAVTVLFERLVLTKTFVGDPVAPGDTVGLELTLSNLDRRSDVTDISFTDDLDAALPGLTAVGLPSSPCGAGSSLVGGAVLGLVGGQLGPEASCTFTVTLQVPSTASTGKFLSTTSAPIGDADGTPVSGQPASDSLFVQAAPILTKTFLADTVGAGGTVTMELGLVNVSSASSVTGITFTDDLAAFLSGTTVTALPASGACGGASIFYSPASGLLTVTGASLPPGGSCTLAVDLGIPAGAAGGPRTNTTSSLVATVDGDAVEGKPASDSLAIAAAPVLSKEFVDDPTLPGGTATLRFTLRHAAELTVGASDITFTDDLDAALSGLVAIGLPASGVCGAGSELSGTSTLVLTGGALGPGESCSFDVALAVPATATPGSVTSTTSALLANVDEVGTTAPAATDTLQIAGLDVVKEMIGDPVIPGGSLTLRFTLDNLSSVDATAITFTDDVADALAGSTLSGSTQTDPCGAGSTLGNAGSTLFFQNGSLAAGASCSFEVTIHTPSSAADGFYRNTTSAIAVTFDGTSTALPAAGDDFEVRSELLSLEKEFTDDPALPGEIVELRFTIRNLHPTEAVGDVAFSDDLDAALDGLEAVSGTQLDVCGLGSSVGGTSVVSFGGGSLAAGATCSFAVSVLVPSGAELGSAAVNTTSAITGTIGGLAVEGAPASDVLELHALRLTKSFAGPVEPGDTVALTFAITNLGDTPVEGLSFSDDLDATLDGLAAGSLPSQPCGTGSSLGGSELVVLANGNLLPGGSCSFVVGVEVPATAAAGTHTNVTSDLFASGIAVAGPATASLVVFEVLDSDGDGVLDDADLCADTVVPESVPTRGLRPNRFALVDGDGLFDTVAPNGTGPTGVFTLADTGGCSCEQIIAALDLGNGHTRFGCSLGAMRDWVELVTAP